MFLEISNTLVIAGIVLFATPVIWLIYSIYSRIHKEKLLRQQLQLETDRIALQVQLRMIVSMSQLSSQSRDFEQPVHHHGMPLDNVDLGALKVALGLEGVFVDEVERGMIFDYRPAEAVYPDREDGNILGQGRWKLASL